MKEIVIIGNKGMLGHMVERWFRQFPNEYQVIGYNRNDGLDVSQRLKSIPFDIHQGTYYINCAGILNNNQNFQECFNVNSVFPQLMAAKCEENNAKFIHISTNCVFQSIGPHSPSDIPDAIDAYGLSKRMGEIDDGYNLTIRTSIIGTELKKYGVGLINQFIHNPDFTTGFKNIFWNGVTTLELAKFIERSLDRTGIVHYFTYEPISKFNLLHLINDIFNVGKELNDGYRNMHQSLLTGPDFIKKSYNRQLVELRYF